MELNWSGTSSDECPSVDIYDLGGRIVRSLQVDVVSDGAASIQWDGQLQNSTRANAGIYYVRVSVGSDQLAETLLLLP